MISFIIPTKNEEKVIEKTLQCLSGYSGPHEIIVSDGNSSDKTIPISKKYTDMVVVHQGNVRQGISAGKNSGVKVAHGEIVLFLDADIFIPDINSFMKKAQECFDQDPKLVGMTVALKVFPEMATLADNLVFAYVNLFDRFFNNVLHIGAAPGEFQMIRNEAFKKVGGYNELMAAGEDYDMFHKLGKIGRTYFNKELVIFHTGRRAHTVGWPKLLFTWAMNYLSTTFLKRSASGEWTEIR